MSKTSRDRKKLIELRRKAIASVGQPKTHIVISLDTYMGDGESSPMFGFAGVRGIYGPFTEAEAAAFEAEQEAKGEYATEYSTYPLKAGE